MKLAIQDVPKLPSTRPRHDLKLTIGTPKPHLDVVSFDTGGAPNESYVSN
jgi:hypothetical protein